MRSLSPESPVSAFEPEIGVAPSPEDVDAIINPRTGKYEPIAGFEVIEKDSIMLVRVRPSGVAMGALRGLLKNGQEAYIFPTNCPEVLSVGIIPLPTTEDPRGI